MITFGQGTLARRKYCAHWRHCNNEWGTLLPLQGLLDRVYPQSKTHPSIYYVMPWVDKFEQQSCFYAKQKKAHPCPKASAWHIRATFSIETRQPMCKCGTRQDGTQKLTISVSKKTSHSVEEKGTSQ